MESTESLTKKEVKRSNSPLLETTDNVHVNWSEVDDLDNTMRKGEISKLDIPGYDAKHDVRGSHEVIIEQVEEEKHLAQQKQNLRYKYLQADEPNSLMKIQASNKRSRRKSLNDAYCTPLMCRSDTYLDIRINEMGVSPQSFEKFAHSHRERREVGREFRNQNSLVPIHANSEDDLKQLNHEDYSKELNLILQRKEERKSGSDPYSPFASFNDQGVSGNPIDDYGRTWTSATLAPPCDTDFWETPDGKRSNIAEASKNEQNLGLELEVRESSGKIKESQSDIVKNIKLTYLSASSLSDDRWICPICLDIFDDAVETPCCHNLFCEQCIVMAHQVNEIQNKIDCPLCNKRYDSSELIPNIPIRRLVNELSIRCINEKCSKVIKKGDLSKHLMRCEYHPVPCPNSNECGLIERHALHVHKTEKCIYRIVPCRLRCGESLQFNLMEEHVQTTCMKEIIKCKNSCGKLLERGLLEKHLRKTCPLEIIPCPNAGKNVFEEGCTIQNRRCDMDDHLKDCEYRKIMCANGDCNSWVLYKDRVTHDEQCPHKIMNCKNKCGAVLERQDLFAHYRICELEPLECTYAVFGCDAEIIRKTYKKHLETCAFEHSMMFIEGQKKVNQENEELKKELHSLRKDYEVEIKAMFLEMQRVKEELETVKQASLQNSSGKNAGQSYHDNPLNQPRQNNNFNNFEKKIPNARYNGNKNEMQYAESHNSSLGNSLFEYSSRSRIYGD